MNTEEWHAEIDVTETLVKNCLIEQFSHLFQIKEIKKIGEGWDNKVFLINNGIVFRFPKRKVAIALMEQENKVLNNIPVFSEVKIPRPRYIGSPSLNYPYPFHGYNLIEGVSSYRAELSVANRISSISTISYFLKNLHAIDEKKAIKIGAVSSIFDRTENEKISNILITRIDKIKSQKIIGINDGIFQKELNNVRDLNLPINDKCFVHGDIDFRHLIFNENHLVGVIDWGDSGINNRAVDLSIIWSFYPQSCHRQFFDIYGDVEANTWQYARFLGLYGSLTLLLYGNDIQDALMVSEAIESLKRINPELIDVF